MFMSLTPHASKGNHQMGAWILLEVSSTEGRAVGWPATMQRTSVRDQDLMTTVHRTRNPCDANDKRSLNVPRNHGPTFMLRNGRIVCFHPLRI